jgi:hypothetical protein
MTEGDKEPKAKASLWARYKARVEANLKKAEASEAKAKSKFESTKFGAAYTKVTKKIDSLKLGKFAYGRILRQVATLAIVITVLGFGFRAMDEWQISGYDYQLSQSQKDEGYEIPYNTVGKSSSPDDIAVRFMTEEESAKMPACDPQEYCWDLKAIPLVKSCFAITIKLEYFRTDNFLEPAIDHTEKVFKDSARGIFLPGATYDFTLGTKNEEAEYATIDRAYCSDFGG